MVYSSKWFRADCIPYFLMDRAPLKIPLRKIPLKKLIFFLNRCFVLLLAEQAILYLSLLFHSFSAFLIRFSFAQFIRPMTAIIR